MQILPVAGQNNQYTISMPTGRNPYAWCPNYVGAPACGTAVPQFQANTGASQVGLPPALTPHPPWLHGS